MIEEVLFGGLAAREDPNRIPFGAALKCENCWTDQDGIDGRNGSRSVNDGTPFAVAGDSVQGIWRLRASASSSRVVVAAGGGLFLISEPTTDFLSNGTITGLDTPFAGTDQISAARLGTNLYVTSNTTSPIQRIVWTSTDTYTLEALSSIPQGAQPTASQSGTLTWTVFTGATATPSNCVAQDNSKTGYTAMNSAWRGFVKTDNANNACDSGAYIQYKIGTAFNAAAFDWVAIAVSPQNGGGISTDRRLGIYVALDVTGSPGTYYQIGQIYDVPPTEDSPNLVYCDLRSLPSAVRAAIQYFKIQVDGSAGGRFLTYGYMFIPTAPLQPIETYYVDFYNPSTGARSKLTNGLTVTHTPATLATYPDSRMGNDVAHSSGGDDDPISVGNIRIFNREAGFPMPAQQDIVASLTINGTTSAYGATSLTVRLWKDTSNGRRLVTSQASVAQSTSYSLADAAGLLVLSNELYKAGGTAPLVYALASHAQRLIGGMENRIYISSFTPTSDISNPIPQWPDIAIEDADGWSFDIAPAKNEQVVAINGDGDAVYIATNLALYVMSDLSPNSPPYMVLRRGAISPRGLCYAEDRIFWVAWDGIYQASNRTNVSELSVGIRRKYIDEFLPDCHTCLDYDLETRSLIVCTDTRMLRYNFVTDRWSGVHTLADSVRHMVSWIDP